MLRAEDSSDVLNIACNLPMTGPFSIYGNSIKEGVDIALEEEKDSASLVNFSYRDNESQTKSAVTVANMQLLDSPDVYVSGLKPQVMAVNEVLDRHRSGWRDISKISSYYEVATRDNSLPHFQWVFDVNVRPNGERDNFRTFLSFKQEPKIFIDYAKKVGAKKVAIIYASLPSTDEEYREIVAPGLREVGVEDVYIQTFQTDLTDFYSLVLNVRKYKPDLLIINGFVENLIAMVRRLDEQQLVRGKHVIAAYDLIDVVGNVRPEWIEGMKVSAPLFLTRKEEDPKIKAWFDKFKNRYHREPNYTHAYAYDMAKILLEASRIWQRRRKGNLEDGISNLSGIIQEVDIEGLTSRLKFDEYGSLPLSIERAVVKGGHLVKDSQ